MLRLSYFSSVLLLLIPQTKIVQEVTPSQLRAQEKAAAIRERSRNAKKKSEGFFTPPQVISNNQNVRIEYQVPSRGDGWVGFDVSH